MTDLREAWARIIDPDAWHDSLPEDGCGAFWLGRRNAARQKVDDQFALLAERGLKIVEEKTFPVQRYGARISWSTALCAYEKYAALYGTSQSLERLAERGGFGINEMDEFCPDWRKREARRYPGAEPTGAEQANDDA